MKTLTAWILIDVKAPKAIDERLPIYWLKYIAEEYAIRYNATVKKIYINTQNYENSKTIL